MTTVPYVSDSQAKISLRPSRQAIKRAALALALTLGIAGAADFGYAPDGTWNRPTTPTSRPTPRSSRPKSPVISRKCWSATTSR